MPQQQFRVNVTTVDGELLDTFLVTMMESNDSAEKRSNVIRAVLESAHQVFNID